MTAHFLARGGVRHLRRQAVAKCFGRDRATIAIHLRGENNLDISRAQSLLLPSLWSMENINERSDPSLPLSKVVRIDQICDRFDHAVHDAIQNGGPWPSVEDYLGDTTEPVRSELRKELLAVEASYRQQQAAGGDPAGLANPAEILGGQVRESGGGPALGAFTAEQTAAYIPSGQPGTIVAGRYKLLEAIGEGGMGTVWVAEQTQPLRRKVAMKLLKPGMDSKSVLARFEAERQALAVMDHPNIAKVLDGGLTDWGRPFFVMEYVKGVPITEYCDTTRLSVPERLNLFVQACQAVQHAHQKGIIHRDLKPSNILVAPYDDRPVPQVIDFGLAKAMHQSLTELTLHTAHGTLLGTPLYMSPEQAQFNNLDIDTRSDIYSLGVLLYELLTGTTPLEKERFKEAAWDEIRRVIREEEPPRPSMRLSSSQALPSLAVGRQMEPARLTKSMRGDLDWIVMKALEKDRTRRYETANGFSLDIQRYLAGEPVLAAPPSATYRLRKFAHKHRAALTTAAGIALLLVAGVAVSAWQAVRATNAEAAARVAEQDALQAQRAETARAEGERLAKLDAQAQKAKAEQAATREKAANAQAQKRLTQIEKANDVLGSIFENLDPREIAKGERPLQAILVEKLDRAVAQLEGESIGDPLVVATMQNKFGYSLLGLGEPGKAIVLLEKARATCQGMLRPEHPLTLAIMNNLARAYQDAGKLDLAVPLFEGTLKLRKAKLGPEHPLTLGSMNNLALAYQAAGKLGLALPLYEETRKLRKAKLGPEHPYTLASMANLASAYQDAGKLDLAVPLFEETLKLRKAKLGPKHPDTLGSMANLAAAYQAAGKLDLALPLYEATLKLRKAELGPDHPDTLTSMNDLAQAYRAGGKLDLALPLCEETLKLTKAKLGPEHPQTLTSMHNLGAAYQDSGKLDLALPLYEETLKLRRAKLGPEHPDTLRSMANLAAAYRGVRKLDLAVPLFEETLKLIKAKLGPDHPDTLTSMNNLASAYQAAGKLDLALPLFEETLKLCKAKLGPDHPLTLTSMNNLAEAYRTAGKPDLALPLLEETLKLMKAELGPEHPQTLISMNNLALAYRDAEKLDLAVPLFEETLKLFKAKLGPEHPNTLNSMNNLALAYRDAGKPDLAVPLFEEAYRAGKKYPSLRGVGVNLLEGYVQAGKTEQAASLAKELLAEARTQLPEESPQLAGQLASIAVSLLQAKAFTEAEPLLQECLSIRDKTQPDEWTTFNSRSMLGGALLGQKKFAEAEPLLLAGYEGMKQRKAKIPPQGKVRLTEALERLVQLYEALEKKDEATKWRKELEARKETPQRVKVDQPRPVAIPGTQGK